MVNLDCLSNGQLTLFVDRIGKVPSILRKYTMHRIDNGLPLKGTILSKLNHEVYLSNLENYASAVLEARKCRIRGDIAESLRLEAFCDEVYDSLPQKAKW